MKDSNMKLLLKNISIVLWLLAYLQIVIAQQIVTRQLDDKDRVTASGSARSSEADEGNNENIIRKLKGLPTDKLKNLLSMINEQKDLTEEDIRLSATKDDKGTVRLQQDIAERHPIKKGHQRKIAFHRVNRLKEGPDLEDTNKDMLRENGGESERGTEDDLRSSPQETRTGNMRQLKKLEPVTNVLIHAFEGDISNKEDEKELGAGLRVASRYENVGKINSQQGDVKEDAGEDVFAGAEENAAVNREKLAASSGSAESRMKLTRLLPKSSNDDADTDSTHPSDDAAETQTRVGLSSDSSKPGDSLALQKITEETQPPYKDMELQPIHSHDDVTTFVDPKNLKPLHGKHYGEAAFHKVIKESLPANIIQEINDAMVERVRESGDRRTSLGKAEPRTENGDGSSREPSDVTVTGDQNNSSDTDANKRVNAGKSQFAFSYDPDSPIGPEMWKVLHTDWTCQGRKQSPINIKTDDVVNDTLCKNIAIRVEPDGRPLTGILRNNGHAPTFSLTSNSVVRLFGGTLPNDYFLKQLHFHFGCENSRGSEHKIDDQGFPMELHLVFWDKKTFDSFAQAAKSDRGIAVVAIMFQRSFVPVNQIRNTPVTQLLRVLKKIPNEGDFVQISEIFDFRLEKLIPNLMNTLQADRFFTYEGSLTTPGCYESVTWIVLNRHPVVTDDQLEMFRKLKSSKVNGDGTMCDNFRPIQKSYGRRIYSNIV